MDTKKQLSVIVPVYNEEKIVNQIINNLKTELNKITDLKYEIIVINDASTDKSEELLKQQNEIKLLNHLKNKGYGASLKTGIKEAQYNWIMIIDADGTYHVEPISEMIKHIPEYDMVVGARKKYRPFYGRPAKWFLNKLASYVAEAKVIDLNSGMRIFKKETVLKFWGLYPDRFSFSSTSTMVCLTNDYTLKYVTIDYAKRHGKSKLKPIKSFKNFIGLIVKLTLYFNPIRVFVPISLIPFFLGVIVFFYSLFFTPKILDTTTAILVVSAIQILAMGMISDLIVKLYKK